MHSSLSDQDFYNDSQDYEISSLDKYFSIKDKIENFKFEKAFSYSYENKGFLNLDNISKKEIENNTYYNKDGNVVTKEEYEKSCLPDNPKTGLNVNYLYAVLIPLVALSSYVVVKKARKFSR